MATIKGINLLFRRNISEMRKCFFSFSSKLVEIKQHKIITSVILLISIILILMFFNPIHYGTLALLKLQFVKIHNVNPSGTNFLWQKDYIGGLGSNGNCNYMVGELRSFNGPREKVAEQYKKVLDDNENAGILFMDGDKWPLDLILWDWRGEFLDQNNIEEGKYYIVYISDKFPSFLDLRC